VFLENPEKSVHHGCQVEGYAGDQVAGKQGVEHLVDLAVRLAAALGEMVALMRSPLDWYWRSGLS